MGSTIQGIQYLRALAAIMVALFHFQGLVGPELDLSMGAKGVDIFFVISGFVIAHAHRQDLVARTSGPGQAWRQFMLKRLIRIVPLYWLTLCCTLGYLAWRAIPFSAPWKDFLFIPQTSAIDPRQIYPAFTPGWTINAEMFFYLLFSLAVAWPRLRYALLALLCGLVAAGQWVHFDVSQVYARFYTHATFAGFILGVLLAQVFHHHDQLGRRLPVWLSWGLLLGGFAGLYAVRMQDGSLWPSLFALCIVAGTIYALQSVHSPLWHQLGDATYAIYLFHLYAVPMARWLLRQIGVLDTPGPFWMAVRLSVCVLIICASGWAVHRWVERPVLAFLRQRLLPSRLPTHA
jgi:exopolysaccharide production protein ExoZ